jgi:hypothetical protein
MRVHTVEEGLGELGLVMVGQQPDVVQLDLLPDVHRQRGSRKARLQQRGRLGHAGVVELDAQRLRPLLARPVAALETGLRLG